LDCLTNTQIQPPSVEVTCHAVTCSHHTTLFIFITKHTTTNNYQNIGALFPFSSATILFPPFTMSPTTHTNDSVVSYINKTSESLIRTIPVFIFLFIMLLAIPTIIYSCRGGCNDEEDNDETSVEFATQDNDNDNEDPTKSHAVMSTNHPIDQS